MRTRLPRSWTRTLAAALAAVLLCQTTTPALHAAPVPTLEPLLTSTSSTPASDPGSTATPPETGKSEVNLGRVLLGFAITTATKYALGGTGPARLLPYLNGLGPAMAVPSLIGLGMIEAAVSIVLFNKIAGIKHDDRQVMAFLLAAGVSALATPLLVGTLGPLGATLVSNAGRLLLYNLIARREGEALTLGISALSLTLLEPDREKAAAPARASVARAGSLAPAAPGTSGAPAAPGPRASLEPATGTLEELAREVRDSYREVVSSPDPVKESAWQGYVRARTGLDQAIQAHRP